MLFSDFLSLYVTCAFMKMIYLIIVFFFFDCDTFKLENSLREKDIYHNLFY